MKKHSHQIIWCNIIILSKVPRLINKNTQILSHTQKKWRGIPPPRWTSGISTQPKFIFLDNIICYPTIYDKQILINHILYTYSIYEKIKFYDENALTMRQAIKALYRLQAYTEVVDLCNERITQSNEEDFEIMYYLSSALYFTREFDKSIDLAKKCVDGLEKSNDYIFYLNALANYASILSGTISQSDLKDENIINKAMQFFGGRLTSLSRIT